MFSEPAVGEKFFGREEVLELLNKRVLALKDGYRQNVALAGQSLAGKTSILHHFLYTIREERFVAVYVEVVKEPFKNFANKFIATLLYGSLAKLGETAEADLDSLLDKAHSHLPKTVAAVKNVYSMIERGDMDSAYSGLLALTSTVKEDIKISCIVILDEFDNIEHLGVKNPFLNFGKVIMVQKDTMYIVSSSRNEAIKKILSEKLSLLFGNFEIVKIPGFDITTARSFIDTKLSGFDISDDIKKFLVDFTDSNPFYLDRITSQARNMALERMSSHIDEEVIAGSILELVYNSCGTIHQYLLNFLLDMLDSRYRESEMAILMAIAGGRNKAADMARSAKTKRSELSKRLARLTELGLISRNGVFYTIDDRLLSYWLRSVYDMRKRTLIDTIFDRSHIFLEAIKAHIDSFIDYSGMDTAHKLKDLFGSFSNDLVQIDSKNVKLPHFTKIEMRPLGAASDAMVASFRGKIWVIQPYEIEASEADVIAYIKAIKSLPFKVAARLIIPLNGIEQTAKLLAKELRISIWDTDVVNMLMSFYGKRRIVPL
jgi:AAA+ ATPase superfamily predicted ATPase